MEISKQAILLIETTKAMYKGTDQYLAPLWTKEWPGRKVGCRSCMDASCCMQSTIAFLPEALLIASEILSMPPVQTNSLELMRSYVQLQEQVHQAQLAIEQARKEAQESALATAETLTAQLTTIEVALAAQRARELEAMQSSNRVMLIMAGTFATLGFAAMILMAYFQWRAQCMAWLRFLPCCLRFGLWGRRQC